MSRIPDEELSFDDQQIDGHHRMILEQYEILADAVREGNSTLIVNKLSKFLNHYTNEHFNAEDMTMLRLRYPDLEGHRREHLEFEEQVNKLKLRIKENGATRSLAVAATGLLYRYIVNHMNKTDVELARYVKARKSQ
jgi:hemerythrin